MQKEREREEKKEIHDLNSFLSSVLGDRIPFIFVSLMETAVFHFALLTAPYLVHFS